MSSVVGLATFLNQYPESIRSSRKGVDAAPIIIKDPQKKGRRAVSRLRSLWALGLYRLEKPRRFLIAELAHNLTPRLRFSTKVPQGETNEPTAPGTIQKLPTEILLLIIDHLSATSTLALSYTCSRFYRMSPIVIEQLFQRYQYLHESQKRLAEQSCFLDLLGKDRRVKSWIRTGKISLHNARTENPKQYKCITCDTLSNSSSFSLAALRGPQETRQCLLHEGKLWICQEHVWSYGEARKYCFGGDFDYKSVLQRRARMQGACKCLTHFLSFQANALIQAIPVAANYTINTRMLVHRNFLEIRFCPHMTLNDPKVLKCFSPACERGFSEAAENCQCRNCTRREADEKMQCSKCKTSFQFRLHRSGNLNNQIVLYFLIRKDLCSVGSDRQVSAEDFNRSWRNHVSLPFEIPKLKEEWQPWKAMYAHSAEHERSVIDTDPFARGIYW